MSDKKNDEKLRILQERLAQIKQKQDNAGPKNQQNEAVIELVNTKNKALKRERKTLNLSWVKKAVIVGSVSYGIFYGYANINFNSLVPSFSEKENSEELISNQLQYKFNLIGNNIAIIKTQNSITDEGSAKAMVNDLKVKGYKCNYFYLPDNSNIKDEVYQVFIGPYENEEETNQWAKNLEAEYNIITL